MPALLNPADSNRPRTGSPGAGPAWCSALAERAPHGCGVSPAAITC
ncbi:hypothetical protein FM106_08455 [Brachybacterium faecium]|nr:hypothetical protein FM106_08455 [Brachybacterium faecium]